MSFFYGPQEMAEMTAAGVGDCPPRPVPLPPEPVAFTGGVCTRFTESLARAYESRGYSRTAQAVRELLPKLPHPKTKHMSQKPTMTELLNEAILSLTEAMKQPDQTVTRIIAAYEAGYEKGVHAKDPEMHKELAVARKQIDDLEDENSALDSELVWRTGKVREIVGQMRVELTRRAAISFPLAYAEKPFMALFATLEKELSK